MTKNKTRRMTIRDIESLPGPSEDAKTSNIEYTRSGIEPLSGRV
ncbi:MAG: hypothetical protein OQK97_00815 [Deltaproteobacteria bacterium]|nr:hypothetical protein [Deltaproteobacteria bacterium]